MKRLIPAAVIAITAACGQAPGPVPHAGPAQGFGSFGAPATPLAVPVSSPPRPGQPRPLGQASQPGPIVARGAAGVLSYDNAAAFYEAFLFSLQQVGAPHIGARVTRDQFITTVGQAFPDADAQSQQALLNARAMWTQVQGQWTTASMDDKRQFVHAVLALALGPQTAAQLTGVSPSGGAPASGTPGGTVVTPNVPTTPGTGCWASAGCQSYDSQGGFTYEPPPTDY